MDTDICRVGGWVVVVMVVDTFFRGSWRRCGAVVEWSLLRLGFFDMCDAM